MADNVYLNGRIVPADQAGVSVADAGFLHGASAFTTMLARTGGVFRLDAHLARLMETVQRFDLRTDATPESLTEATGQLLAANALTDARVRITLTSGSVHNDHPTTVITAQALPDYPPQWYQQGLTVVVSSFRQPVNDPTCGHKTGCYFTRMLARHEAASAGGEEALWYTPDHHLAEACFCNVFLLLGGKVCTPPLNTPVLPGVVRGAVLELCSEHGIEFDAETPLTVKEMLAAEEMFITASCSGIRPIVRVERHPVGDEKPGPVTQKLMAAYEDLVAAECGGPGSREQSA